MDDNETTTAPTRQDLDEKDHDTTGSPTTWQQISRRDDYEL